MIAWAQTPDGWAVNLDGTNAAVEYTLPRVELHSGSHGWTCVCHRGNGTSRELPLGRTWSIAAAKRSALAEALRTLGPEHQAELRALLARSGAETE